MINHEDLEEMRIECVHNRLKELCKIARNQKCMTNQDIADAISEKYGVHDFSVNTVNNFFSERSKATTVYTTGCICAVLDVSIDEAFGIVRRLTDDTENKYLTELAELNSELKVLERENRGLSGALCEKDKRIEQAHAALEFYRNEVTKREKYLQPWVLYSVLTAFVVLFGGIVITMI